MADLFDIAIARKLSGGGGGGSSDFSTAQVTIAGLENDDELPVLGAFVLTDEEYGPYLQTDGSFLNGTYDFVLYKGRALIWASTISGIEDPVISGNYDEDTQIATGNITITVTYF